MTCAKPPRISTIPYTTHLPYLTLPLIPFTPSLHTQHQPLTPTTTTTFVTTKPQAQSAAHATTHHPTITPIPPEPPLPLSLPPTSFHKSPPAAHPHNTLSNSTRNRLSIAKPPAPALLILPSPSCSPVFPYVIHVSMSDSSSPPLKPSRIGPSQTCLCTALSSLP